MNSVNCKNKDVNLTLFISQKIKERLGDRTFLRFFRDLVCSTYEDMEIRFFVKKIEIAKYISENFLKDIEDIIYKIWKNKDIKITFSYLDDVENIEKILLFRRDLIIQEDQNSQKIKIINEYKDGYEFENFLVSQTNILAHTVAKSICCLTMEEDAVPSGSISYIYGNSGVGKTHLLRAMEKSYKNDGGKIIYLTGSGIVRLYVNSVKEGNFMNFREEILKNEIILIDNIDEIAGKVGTTNATEAIIKEAMESKKYIVISSKYKLEELKQIDQKINNMIISPIVFEIQNQEIELLIRIGINEIKKKNLKIPLSVVEAIVKLKSMGAREIKSYLSKLALMQKVYNVELNDNLAIEFLSKSILEKEKIDYRNIAEDDIISKICNYYKVEKKFIFSSAKTRDICNARNAIILILNKDKGFSYSEIGRLLKKNHATIIGALKKITDKMSSDQRFMGELANIRNLIENQK